MQSIESQIPHSMVGQILYGVALLVTGGVVKELLDWARNRRRAKAEVIEISAQTVKVQAEARQVDTETVIRASERIEELLDLNDSLRSELIEANRRLDNTDFDLRNAQTEIKQMRTASELREYLIEQLQAANKLGVKLSDLPPRPKHD